MKKFERNLVTALSAACISACMASCTVDINPEELDVSIEDYTEWDRVEPLIGEVPGHGDSYRIMYRNDVARSYTGAGEYRVGTAVVKEIYERKGERGKGKLLYKAVMRKLDPDENGDLPLDDGWLFTQIDDGTDEFQRDLCWASCHVNAPYLGAFFNHGY